MRFMTLLDGHGCIRDWIDGRVFSRALSHDLSRDAARLAFVGLEKITSKVLWLDTTHGRLAGRWPKEGRQLHKLVYVDFWLEGLQLIGNIFGLE